ncbi:unnamed protein product [Meganyctiphanes norvegica]|uniref:Uncharacterized protein n=1 Tax=Meganyctiphanes norvegica TaxID=48144 RepID=A0AAV2RL19_MEGNR
MYAVDNGHLEVVNMLLDDLYDARLYSRDERGNVNSFTALHIAIQNEDEKMVKRLMRACPDLTQLHNDETYMEMATPDIRRVILSERHRNRWSCSERGVVAGTFLVW